MRAHLFDLDGTLLDSAPDLAAAANAARAALDLPPLPIAAVQPHIGHGLGHLLRGVVPGGADLDALRPVFLAHYRANLLTHSRPFAGAEALLARCGPAALVTNKPEAFTRPILEGLGWRFAAVVCGDTTPRRKPHPEPLRHALRALQVDPAEAVYVGDSEVDLEAAAAAGVDFVCVPWGRAADRAPRVAAFEALP